jgi:TPR repeat protein
MSRKELKKGKAGIARALALIEKASKNGDASAAYALATWFLFGGHVKKDYGRAVVLLKQAAKDNISEALYDLAVCYEKGSGARKNEKKAYELYLSVYLGRQAIHC